MVTSKPQDVSERLLSRVSLQDGKSLLESMEMTFEDVKIAAKRYLTLDEDRDGS